MKYKIYKLTFLSGVHFGKQDLSETEATFGSDLLFSALCLEALQIGKDEFQGFYKSVKEGELKFTDAFPYIGNELYVPKPLIHVEREKSEISSKQKKAAKKLKYLPINQMGAYVAGNLDLEKEVQKLGALGKYVEKTAVSINGVDEPKPYRIGVFYFQKNCGLYICVAYSKQESLEVFERLLSSLSYTGIGGEKSSGFGRFSYEAIDAVQSLVEQFEGQYKNYMAVSGCMASANEMDEILKGACYLLKKRSGFISSSSMEDQNYRKKDFYIFAAGSCFEKKFSGDIFDVSRKGTHPVYRYAKPMFIGVIK